MEQTRNIPCHVAVILDGNGRWAKEHHVPRQMGHKAGCENLEQVVEDAARLGIRYFTIYGFSTENWKRSAEEVGALMSLFRYYIGRLRDVAMANDIRVRMIGERSRFDQDLIDGLNMLEDVTKDNRGMTFILALNYGGRDEIAYSARKIAEKIKSGELNPEDITEQTIADNLYTAGMPDVDLVIRPSGELRLSNYLIWQCAYAEYYFTNVLWPDFSPEELNKALIDYAGRGRRFGGV